MDGMFAPMRALAKCVDRRRDLDAGQEADPFACGGIMTETALRSATTLVR